MKTLEETHPSLEKYHDDLLRAVVSADDVQEHTVDKAKLKEAIHKYFKSSVNSELMEKEFYNNRYIKELELTK